MGTKDLTAKALIDAMLADKLTNEQKGVIMTELMRSGQDAERLDYIASNARCDPKMDGQHVWWPTSFNHRLTGPTLREAIDAAMVAR